MNMNVRFLHLSRVRFPILFFFIGSFLFNNPIYAEIERFESPLIKDEITLIEAIHRISEHYQVLFNYDRNIVSNIKVRYEPEEFASVDAAIASVLKDTNLKYQIFSQRYVVIYKNDQEGIESLKEMIQHFQTIVDDREDIVLERQRLQPTPRLIRTIPQEVLDAQAFSFSIEGIVTDQQGDPLIGVNIQVKGTNLGTSTDMDGKFLLKSIEENAVLVVSYIGYQTQEIAVAGKSNLSIILMSDSQLLDEVVVVGYGTQQKKDLTGSVTVVNVDNMTRQATGLVTDQLQGQASGVTVTTSGQPGESPQVLIRGINSFGNNTPLYVVNGVPTQNISSLNANDISSIQILKDAGAASIYGSRASNGVIIITTTKGSGKLNLTFDSFYGAQIPIGGNNPLEILSPLEQAELKFLASANSGIPISSANPDPLYGPGPNPTLPDYISPLGASKNDPSVDPSLYYVDPFYTKKSELDNFYRITPANKAGTHWYRELFKTAPINNNNLSISGSSDNINYFFSANYLNQVGNIENTYLKRYSIRTNASFTLSDRLSIGENIQFTLEENPIFNSRHHSLHGVFNIDPIIPVYDIMGNFAGVHGTQLSGKENPVANAYRTKENSNIDRRILGNIFLNYDIIKDVLSYHTSLGADILSNFAHSFQYPQYENNQNRDNNNYNESTNSYNDITWFNTLEFQKLIKNVHDLNVLIGSEINSRNERMSSGSISSFYSFDPDYVGFSTGTENRLLSHLKNEYKLISQFLRTNYSYRDKYLFSFTIRHDGSSRFSKQNRFGWFPAVSAGWRLSQEDFINKISWISDLKLRASYGVMGNQMNVSPSNAFSTFVQNLDGSFYDISGSNNSLTPGFQVGQIGNPDASWEKNKNLNIGLDLGLENGTHFLSIDYFNKNIEGLLYNPALLATQGSGIPPYVNIAGMSNEGIDLNFSSRYDITNEINVQGTLSFTHYRNEITKVSEVRDFFDTPKPGGFSDASYIRNQVGHPVSSFFAYKVTGLWNSDAEIEQANSQARQVLKDENAKYQEGIGLGRFKYEDVNGDGIISPDDRTFIGSPNPDFTYGLNLGITVKNFDVSTFIYGVHGNDIMNVMRQNLDFYGAEVASGKRALYDSWTPERKNATVPIQELSANFSTSATPNSYYLEKGSYLKVKNIQVGYNLPSGILKRINAQMIRIYAQGSNLFTLTNYLGLDPEILGNINEYEVSNQGVDRGTYPAPRQIIGGIKIIL